MSSASQKFDVCRFLIFSYSNFFISFYNDSYFMLKVFPAGNGETFCTHIFRIFDSDGNNFLDFKVRKSRRTSRSPLYFEHFVFVFHLIVSLHLCGSLLAISVPCFKYMRCKSFIFSYYIFFIYCIYVFNAKNIQENYKLLPLISRRVYYNVYYGFRYFTNHNIRVYHNFWDLNNFCFF